MPLHNALTEGFSHRPLGTRAVRIASPAGDPDSYEAVLKLDDASIHVRAVKEESDGAFSGTVFSIDPGDSSVAERIAVGDGVSFRGSQVFTFTGFRDETERPAQRHVEASPRRQAARVDPSSPPGRSKPGRQRMLLAVCGAALLVSATALWYLFGSAKELPSTPPAGVTDGAGRLKMDDQLRSHEAR